jgi:hypothetical protein
LGSRNIVRERDDPVALDAGLLGVAAMVNFAQAVTISARTGGLRGSYRSA